MAQQTSVEWLEERLSVSLGDEIKYLRGFFVIAKEMHKEEHKETFLEGRLYGKFVNFKNYYNETFNK